MALVQLDDVWVTANFKETQLTKMRPGQRVTVDVDAYGGSEFNGHVDSIAARDRRALQPAAAGERDRQLRQGRAARAGEDRARRRARIRSTCCGPGMSVTPTVYTK